MNKKKAENALAKNKKAHFEYDLLEFFETGISLTGTEVRSLRDNHCQITDAFALVRHGEVWLHGLHIPPFKQGNIANVDSDRKRKLLLHKKEIRYLEQKTQEKGMALVPTKIYFKEGHLVKVEIALARGKKLFDKRASMAERDAKRSIDRALKARIR